MERILLTIIWMLILIAMCLVVYVLLEYNKRKKWLDDFFDDLRKIKGVYINENIKTFFINKYKIPREKIDFPFLDINQVNAFKKTYDEIEEIIKKNNYEYTMQKKWLDDFFEAINLLKTKYISHRDKTNFIYKYQYIRESFDIPKIEDDRIKLLIDIYDKFDLYVKRYNEQYIEKELEENNIYFNNLFDYPLDDEQRRAVVIDEDNQLIIAGAGSGKTTTIIGKTRYLIEKKNILPENIITISFTNAATDNFRDKISNKKVHCSTFHKLAKDILEENKVKLNIVENDYLKKIIIDFLEKEIHKVPELSKNLTEFYSYYMHYQNNKDIDFSTEIEYSQGADLETLRSKYESQHKNTLDTLNNERVKSIQELVIANFLFVNGINYIYEPNYKYRTASKEFRQYKPDFYLPDYDIYIEHFGIDITGRAKQYPPEEERKYLEGINWKRDLHQRNNTKLLEIYSSDFYDYNIDERLTSKLQSQEIKFNPISPEELIKTINKINNQEMISFHSLIEKFIEMFKGNNYEDIEFETFLKDSKKNNNKRRVLLLNIIRAIYNYYQDKLKSEERVDFNDMINFATKEIINNYDKKIDYIIIDEFQDISYSRYEMIKELQNKTNAKVVAVGDDWQSIFRFSGCDLDLFVKFEKYFDAPNLSYINNTYRCPENIIDLSSKFIMMNKNGQIEKKLVTTKLEPRSAIEYVYYDQNIIEATRIAIEKLEGVGCKKIAILGRNNSDIKRYNYEDTKKETDLSNLFKKNVIFTNIHRSKGLEYDGVILCNLNNYISGFPNKMADDEVLSYVTLTEDDYPYEEERRLFYVALTRAKKKCVLLIPKNESIFSKELFEISNKTIPQTGMEGIDLINRAKCPKCGTGILVERYKDGNFLFFGCNNFPACDYKDKKTEKNTFTEKRKYIDVKFENYYKTYTYLCPKNFKYKKGSIVTINSNGKLKRVTIASEPYEGDNEILNGIKKVLEVVEK